MLYGDANGDGAINALDVIATKKYLVGIYDENINENLMDANCDGKINAKDLLAIKKKILGI